MAIISAGDQTNLRDKRHEATVFLSIFKPTTLLDARVNDAGIARGERSIIYNGGSGNFPLIETHQLIKISALGAGQYEKGIFWIKNITGTVVAGTITMPENSVDWDDNDYVRIEHFYGLHPRLPNFDVATEIFYKDIGTGPTGVTYAAAGDPNLDTPPVVCVTPHRAREYRGTPIVFDFDAGDSYAIADGTVVISYAASVQPVAGAVLVINGGTGVGTLTCSIAGQWWVKFTATDDNGKSQDSYRSFNTNPPDVKMTYNPLQGDWPRGYVFSIDLPSTDNLLTDVPDGALAVLWYDNKFDGVSGFVDLWGDWDGHICYGYLRRDTSQTSYETGAEVVSFEFTTAEALLDSMSEYGSIDLEAKASPAEWYEFDANNLTPGTGADHILRWHSTAHLVCELWGFKDNDKEMQFMVASEGSLLQRVNNLGWQKGIFASLVSDRMGRLHFVQDSQMLNDTDRAALDTVFTLDAKDVSGDIVVPREPEKRVLLSNLDGFTFDPATLTSDAFMALAPGTAPEPFGTGKSKVSGQVVEDQTDVNERTGRLHSVANAQYGPWPLRFRGNYLGAFDIIPSIGFYVWDLVDNTLARELPLNGSNLICRRVSSSIDNQGNIFMDVDFEVEAPSYLGESETYPSAPGCKPGQGSTAGINDQTRGDEEIEAIVGPNPNVVLATFASTTVSKRQFGVDVDWSTLTTDAGIEHGKFDPFWPRFALTYDPDFLRYSYCGAGLIKDVVGQAGTPASALPVSPPPNTWSDATAPTTGNVIYLAEFYDLFVALDRYFLISYQFGGLWRGWLMKRSGVVDSYLPLFSGALPTQVKPVWLAVTCAHILVTSWHDLATDKLKMLVFDKSPFAYSTEYDLGNGSLAQLDDREHWAFPVATPDYSDGSPDATAPFIAAGIMVNPAVMAAGTYYALHYDGSSWSEIEVKDDTGVTEDMLTDWIGSMVAGPADTVNGRAYWAFRQGING
jgi:hypothetical protein